MTKFINTWNTFKDKTILKNEKKILNEFSNKEKNNILKNGDNFTISYEIEMESQSQINEDGDYTSGYGNGSMARRADNMSSRDQVEYFGMEDSLRESASETEADDEFFNDIFVHNGDSESTDPVLLAIIACYKDDLGIVSLPVELKDSDIETFILASYLNDGGRGFKYNEQLTDISKDEYKFRNLLKIAQQLGAEIGSASILSETEKEEFIGNLLGFSGEEWETTFNSNRISPRKFFEAICNPEKGYFEREELILEKACKWVYNYRSTANLGNLSYFSGRLVSNYNSWNYQTGVHEEKITPYAPIAKFDEFKVGVRGLAKIAENQVDSLTDNAIDNFDYSDYGLEDSLDDDGGGGGTIGGNALEDHLPNFWRKYGSNMKTMSDGSLPSEHSIEIAMDKYLHGVKEAMEHLDIFFKDYDNQDNFSFTNKTGLHTNISMDLPNKQFNLIKLLFALSEETKEGKSSIAYRGIGSRFKSNWSGPIKEILLKNIREVFKDKQIKNDFKRLYQENNFDGLTTRINEIIKNKLNYLGIKSHGLNLHYITSRGYIEFRYPGHDLQKESLQDLTLYYCYLVQNALDPGYNDEIYKKKLIGFMQELFSVEGPSKIDKLKTLIEAWKTFIPSIYPDDELESIFLKEMKTKISYGGYRSDYTTILKNTDFKITLAGLEEVDTKLYDRIDTTIEQIPTLYERFFLKLYTEPKKIFLIHYFLTFIRNNYQSNKNFEWVQDILVRINDDFRSSIFTLLSYKIEAEKKEKVLNPQKIEENKLTKAKKLSIIINTNKRK